MSSLLEVGTGFHGELNGRENIYLNGAILGMREAQIKRRFDEIVAFADVSKFLETPVKHYFERHVCAARLCSRGAPRSRHSDCQRSPRSGRPKVSGEMYRQDTQYRVAQDRTVLFVSHNMANIRQLCTSAILLNGGRLTLAGATEEVIRAYTKSPDSDAPHITVGGNGVEMRCIRIVVADSGESTNHPIFNRDYVLELMFEAQLRCATPWCSRR